ncbi:hypothetical protein BJ875DRAFT_149039 [Amylocarpus encephaloides]|uniref:Glycosyltransferase family 25 protein n=1 Tax=Amylocarpus encephaloides TaxID=45428 RepID=A0A9P7YPU1_9HELO|nr:hypothetical protein BJ875DRAFT_149039 [Amylocarpus encephaloides]
MLEMPLSFQSILALSVNPSWRTRGLSAAAKYTGLEIDVLEQPPISREMVQAFKKIESSIGKTPSNGSAYAWLAHLDVIKHAITSNMESVLIIEDDVDWDVNIKHQMQLVSDNIRKFTEVNATDATPYGHAWDLLWLGHCGEHTDADTPRIEFSDPTVPDRKTYTGWANKYRYNVDSGKRAIQRGVNPVCSFGYALSRKGAVKVLEWASKGGNEAFDIKLLQGCQWKSFDCMVVTPEVMHHYTPLKELGYKSLVVEENGKGPSTKELAFEHAMGGTENIVESARCKVLFDATCQKDHRDYY